MTGVQTCALPISLALSSDLKTAKLSIGTIESDAVNKIDLKAKAAAGPKLTINYTGITADDLNNVADDLGGLAKNISVAEGTNTGLTATANVAEGLLKGSVSADLDTAAICSTVKVDSVKQNKKIQFTEAAEDIRLALQQEIQKTEGLLVEGISQEDLNTFMKVAEKMLENLER